MDIGRTWKIVVPFVFVAAVCAYEFQYTSVDGGSLGPVWDSRYNAIVNIPSLSAVRWGTPRIEIFEQGSDQFFGNAFTDSGAGTALVSFDIM